MWATSCSLRSPAGGGDRGHSRVASAHCCYSFGMTVFYSFRNPSASNISCFQGMLFSELATGKSHTHKHTHTHRGMQSADGVRCSKSYRDLGVNILADLSPEIHINGIVRAAYAFLSNVRVPFRQIDKEMFRNIYVTY
ncbi:hypothetical protein SK128_000378, partial [Halocaridina rubra]